MRSKWSGKIIALGAVLVVFPLIVLLIRSRANLDTSADAPPGSVEAEAGTLSLGATVQNDGGASGGQFVRLVANPITPTIYPSTTPEPPGGGTINYIASTIARSIKGVETITLNKPAGTQPGDVMIALLQSDYSNIGGTLPPDWHLITERMETTDLSAHAYYKVAGNQEPGSYTWQVINIGRDFCNQPLCSIAGGTLLTFRGVSNASPIYSSAINPETSNTARLDCPSTTTPVGGMLACMFTHDDPQPDISPPSSMTRVSNFIIPTNGNDDGHAAAYERISVSGQTGIRSAVIDPNISGGGNDIGLAVVLRPSSTAISTPTPTPGGPTVTPRPTLPPLQVDCKKYVAPNGNDSNDGSIGSPWRTINASAPKLNATNHTLCIRAGQYSESVRIQVKGTASQRLTFAKYPGDSGDVVFSGQTFQVGAWNANNQSAYLNVSGITVRNSNDYGFNHFGDNNRIGNIEVTGSQKGGMNVVYSHNTEFDNIRIFDNVKSSSWNCNPNVGGGWPSAFGITKSSYISVRNSEIGNNCGEGLNGWDATDHLVFANNTIYDNWSVDLYLDHSWGTVIENNLIYETETSNPGNKSLAHGISLADENFRGQTTCELRDNTIRNNIVIGTKSGINNFNYLPCTGLRNTKVENNTIVNQWEQGIRILGAGSQNSYIRNNIVFPRPGVPTLVMPNQNDTVITNNLYTDPLLVNRNGCNQSSCPAANFKLTAGSVNAIDKGVTLSLPYRDYFGSLRTAPFDIGAHEY